MSRRRSHTSSIEILFSLLGSAVALLIGGGAFLWRLFQNARAEACSSGEDQQ